MITGVLGVLGALTTWLAALFTVDFWRNRDKIESKSTWASSAGIGFITDFFDRLGIGSFATSTALMRAFDQTEDRMLPGTLNVAHALPTILEAFIFMKVIEVEPITLISMLASATLMISGQLGIMPTGGEAIGLSGGKLAIAVVGNFVLGVLMTAGIGLYAPCMALIFTLGLSPRVAYTIFKLRESICI